jgi:hypothetical protein
MPCPSGKNETLVPATAQFNRTPDHQICATTALRPPVDPDRTLGGSVRVIGGEAVSLTVTARQGCVAPDRRLGADGGCQGGRGRIRADHPDLRSLGAALGVGIVSGHPVDWQRPLSRTTGELLAGLSAGCLTGLPLGI